MSQLQNKKIRAISAKANSPQIEKYRPMSGISAAMVQHKKQLIESVYMNQMNTFPSRENSAKKLHLKNHLILAESDKIPKKISVKLSKQKQQLMQENQNLKRSINKLVEQLAQQKGKIQNIKKKPNKYMKTLQIEFQKQIYYMSHAYNGHLIAGIKNNYENLKSKYQEKCSQYEEFTRKRAVTKESEYIAYIEILQKQNRTLNDRFQRIAANSITILAGNNIHKQANQFVVAQLEMQRKQLLSKVNDLESKYKMSCEGFKDRNKKIQFLDKLIIEKDNAEHASHRKFKDAEKYAIDLKERYTIESNQLRETNEQLWAKLQLLESQHEKELTLVKQKLDQEIRDKAQRNKALHKENQYLEGMIKELRATNNQLNLNLQNFKVSKNNFNQNIAQNQDLQKKEISNQIIKASSEKKQESKKQYQKHGVYENGLRIAQKSNKKHSENAVKKRRLQFTQIQGVCEFLRYKLTGLNISFEELNRLFDFHEQSSDQNSMSQNIKQQQIWKKQYINMEEIYTIFRNEKINLCHEDALALARYAIEDVAEEFVYCDNMNENTRNIVKAIFKNIIGQYQVYSKESSVSKRVNQILDKYRSNLQASLRSIAPNGRITKKRFLELIGGLGIEDLMEDTKQCLIGRMAVNSSKISELVYQELL